MDSIIPDDASRNKKTASAKSAEAAQPIRCVYRATIGKSTFSLLYFLADNFDAVHHFTSSLLKNSPVTRENSSG